MAVQDAEENRQKQSGNMAKMGQNNLCNRLNTMRLIDLICGQPLQGGKGKNLEKPWNPGTLAQGIIII